MSYQRKTIIVSESKETMSDKDESRVCRNPQAMTQMCIDPNKKDSNIKTKDFQNDQMNLFHDQKQQGAHLLHHPYEIKPSSEGPRARPDNPRKDERKVGHEGIVYEQAYIQNSMIPHRPQMVLTENSK
jgi:hypothetical protein